MGTYPSGISYQGNKNIVTLPVACLASSLPIRGPVPLFNLGLTPR